MRHRNGGRSDGMPIHSAALSITPNERLLLAAVAASRKAGHQPGQDQFSDQGATREGLLKAGNFRRAENKLKYVYLLTPKGFGETVRLTRAYLARKEAEYEALQAEIKALKREMKAADEPH